MEFYESLRNAIIQQAINDYSNAVKKIMYLNDGIRARDEIIKNGLKRQTPKQYTFEEAEKERVDRIKIAQGRLHEVENFFLSSWYKTICTIDCEYMLKMTKEKAIDDMVKKCILLLKEVDEKNFNSAKSKKAIEDYETLKLFLQSEWLEQFTEKTSEYYIGKIKRESNIPEKY